MDRLWLPAAGGAVKYAKKEVQDHSHQDGAGFPAAAQESPLGNIQQDGLKPTSGLGRKYAMKM